MSFGSRGDRGEIPSSKHQVSEGPLLAHIKTIRRHVESGPRQEF